MSRQPGAPASGAPPAHLEDQHTRREDEQVLELREEQLIAHKDLEQVGEVIVRTRLEEAPARLEVEACREEVEVEHEPVGQVVSERGQPWEEDGTLVVPIYEEQLVVTKRLVLRERLRIRRVSSVERQVFEDTVRRERLVIEDPQHTGLVHEVFPKGPKGPTGPKDQAGSEDAAGDASESGHAEQHAQGGFLEQLARKALQ